MKAMRFARYDEKFRHLFPASFQPLLEVGMGSSSALPVRSELDTIISSKQFLQIQTKYVYV
jgi:hypothetical protein